MDSTMRPIALFSLLALSTTASAQDPQERHEGHIQFEIKVETVTLDQARAGGYRSIFPPRPIAKRHGCPKGSEVAREGRIPRAPSY